MRSHSDNLNLTTCLKASNLWANLAALKTSVFFNSMFLRFQQRFQISQHLKHYLMVHWKLVNMLPLEPPPEVNGDNKANWMEWYNFEMIAKWKWEVCNSYIPICGLKFIKCFLCRIQCIIKIEQTLFILLQQVRQVRHGK